eukprot:4483978-Prymnesium_polylepis.1
MPDRTLYVLPWSCLESLEPVRARVFGRTNSRCKCALPWCLRVCGLDCADSEVHSPPPSSIGTRTITASRCGPRSGRSISSNLDRHFRRRVRFFLVRPAPPAQPGHLEPQQPPPLAQFSPVVTPPHAPPLHPRQALMGDGDSLWRSFD